MQRKEAARIKINSVYSGQNELNAFTTKSGCGKIAVGLAEVSLLFYSALCLPLGTTTVVS